MVDGVFDWLKKTTKTLLDAIIRNIGLRGLERKHPNDCLWVSLIDTHSYIYSHNLCYNYSVSYHLIEKTLNNNSNVSTTYKKCVITYKKSLCFKKQKSPTLFLAKNVCNSVVSTKNKQKIHFQIKSVRSKCQYNQLNTSNLKLLHNILSGQ